VKILVADTESSKRSKEQKSNKQYAKLKKLIASAMAKSKEKEAEQANQEQSLHDFLATFAGKHCENKRKDLDEYRIDRGNS